MADAKGQERSAASPRWTFRFKLTLLAITMALVPVSLVGIISMEVNKRALSEANRELLFSVLQHIGSHVEDGFERDREDLGVAATVLMDSSQPLQQRLDFLDSLVGAGRLPLLAVFDGKGDWIDTIRPAGVDGEGAAQQVPKVLSEQQRAAAGANRVHVDEPARSPDGPGLLVPLIAQAEGNSETWYLLSYVDLDDIQRELEAIGHERLGRGHTLMILDTSLRVVADSQLESIGTTLQRPQGILAGLEPEALDEGILVFGDSVMGERAMLGAVRSMEWLPWAVAAEVPRDVAYRSIAKIRWVLWGVVAVAAMLALVIAVFMARRISAPLQKLVAFAGELANRRFDKRVEVETQDELSLLGRALSSAASELEASDERIRQEERIRSDLGRYLPGHLVDNIVEDRQDLALGGQRSNVTVLFADVVGFTPLAESHAAEEVVDLLNELFTILTEIIFRHGGTIDKFIGDSVMAFWGAPDPQEDHAQRALRAAEDMMRWLEVANEGWGERFGIRIQLAVGVNTGEAVVGNFGSAERMEYTAIGDCVNVAARLESIARPQQILITKSTCAAAGKEFDYHSLGMRKVVGREAPIELFEVVQ